MNRQRKIMLIYTGGTIGMVKDFSTGTLKTFDFDKLVEHIPELHHLGCSIDSISFKRPIDSSNMNTDHWKSIASSIEKHYDNYDGFVILHGSDTMSYSASALSFMLENLGKPVIFTGSQLPIGDLRTDAKENLITTIQLAALHQNDTPIIREVGLYFEYKLYRANRTTKTNAEHFEAFASKNYPALAESGVHLKVYEEYLLPAAKAPFSVQTVLDRHVAILKIFPGIHPSVVRGILEIPDLKGVVLETFGSGNAPTEFWLLEALQKAVNEGIHIVNVTQCSGGSVLMGRYETSEALLKMSLINGGDITSEAAITKLMYLLGKRVDPSNFKSRFETPIRGEMALF
ncbi:MAG: asparaginase [Eudoraea sp.]|nr:asparaginase [Eudoraea sp.]